MPFFGLDRLAGGTPGAVIPVLSCGGVSLQSSAYPRGLQSFHADAPARFPLFRSSWQDTVELNAPALAAKDVRSSAAHWRPTRAYEERGLGTVLHHLLAPDTLALKRFGEQAARVNAKLYAALFPDARPVVAYLGGGNRPGAADRRSCPARFGIAQGAVYAGPARGALRRLAGVRGCWSPAWLPAAGRPDSRERHGLFLGRRRRGRQHLCACRRTTARSISGASICRLCRKPSSEPCATGTSIRGCSFPDIDASTGFAATAGFSSCAIFRPCSTPCVIYSWSAANRSRLSRAGRCWRLSPFPCKPEKPGGFSLRVCWNCSPPEASAGRTCNALPISRLKRSFPSASPGGVWTTHPARNGPRPGKPTCAMWRGKASPLKYHEIKAVRHFPDNKARF
ncbi:MAG: hypothetical protein ACLSAH_11245 [Bilophila wadsworthia]